MTINQNPTNQKTMLDYVQNINSVAFINSWETGRIVEEPESLSLLRSEIRN
jgi:hypothetical protein